MDCGLAGTVLRFVPPVAALGTETVVDSTATSRPGPAPSRRCWTRCAASASDIDGDAPAVLGARHRRGARAARSRSTRRRRRSSSPACCCPGAAFTDGLTIVHTGTSVPSAPHVAMTVAMLRDAGVDVDDADDQPLAGVAPGPIARAALG